MNIVKALVPRFIVDYYRVRKYGERRKHLGDENPDKIFYIIGFRDVKGGIFWIVNKMLMHLAYALDKGYIPVVDYKYNETQYTGEGELGKVNIWEKFFKQPANYSLEDVMKSQNVIYSCKYASPDDAHFMGNFYEDKKKIEYFRHLYKEYVHYTDYVEKYLKENESLLQGKGRILGVLCRGTDYVTLKPGGHPIPPTAQQVIEKTKQVLIEQHCDHIFLATEDEEVYMQFLKEFGDTLIVNHQKRVAKNQLKSGKELSTVKMKMAKTGEARFISGLEYLCAIYLLSRCDCFVGVRCGGTKGALILSDGYDYEYTFDLGMYQ